MLKVLLAALLWPLSSQALEATKARSVIEMLWLKTFHQRVRLDGVRIVNSDSMPGNIAARYVNNHIQVRRHLSMSDAFSILKHEYAHAALDKVCSGKVESPWLNEGFVLWLSKDLIRTLNSSKQFVYVSSAEHWLKKFAHQHKKYPAQFNQALARLMLIDGRQTQWGHFFREMIEDCNKGTFNQQKTEQSFLTLLKLPLKPIKPTNVDILVMEGLSKKILVKKGHTESRLPVASHTKPLLAAIIPSTQTSQMSEDNIYWDCPTRANGIKQWNWQEALVKSCNGFFLNLNLKSEHWGQWHQFLKSFGVNTISKNISESIGLMPGLKLSLSELVRAYDLISELQPQVIEALRKTAESGTLSASPAAQWFLDRKIALKSGTLRNREGVPLHSYVVALGPYIEPGNAQFIAAIHAHQQSSAALLVKLKNQLQALHLDQKPLAKVQVLGLANYKEVHWRCKKGPSLLRSASYVQWEKPQAWDSFKDHFNYSCAGEPIQLRFKNRKGLQMTRNYYGSIYVEPEKDLPKPHSRYPMNPRYFRARRGSSLTLNTSRRHYLVELLSSEYPRGSMETLKALASIGLNNLNFPRHGHRPICDTTHCQVYGHGAKLPQSYARRISKAVNHILSRKQIEPEKWMPFSLGGTEPWSQELSSDVIRQQLRLGFEVESIKKSKDKLLLEAKGLKKEISCEIFRNQLGLKSCPDRFVKKNSVWKLTGQGEGHNLGLDLKMADSLSRQGKTYDEILKHFFHSSLN